MEAEALRREQQIAASWNPGVEDDPAKGGSERSERPDGVEDSPRLAASLPSIPDSITDVLI